MQKKSFVSYLLPAIGYMFMGNLLAGVMSFSLGMFRGDTAVMLIASFLAMAIYFLLIAVPAYKDGLKTGQSLEFKKLAANENAKIPGKTEWLLVGVVLWLIMSIPSLVFAFGGITDGVLRLLSGATAPVGWILIDEPTEHIEFPLLPWSPWVFIGIYSLGIPACYIGYLKGLAAVKK
jgi:uncharacterized membrane protein